jgi:hypothetical protein
LKHSEEGNSEPPEINLDRTDVEVINRALTLLRKMEVYLSKEDFRIVEHLGQNVLGRVSANKIYIAKQTLHMGAEQLAGTLFEEYCHKNLGYDDESRSFQNYLIDKIVHLARKL